MPMQQIDAGFRLGGGDGGGHIAVADQADARAGLAHFLDERLMARPDKNDHRKIFDSAALRLGQRLEIFGRRLVEIDDALAGRSGRDLFHVGIGAMKQVAAIRHGDAPPSALGPPVAQMVVPSSGSSAMSTLGPPRADLLADVEHRRFVALAFADHHRAVDGKRIERLAHRVHRRLVRRFFVAAAGQPGAIQRRRFGYSHGF